MHKSIKNNIKKVYIIIKIFKTAHLDLKNRLLFGFVNWIFKLLVFSSFKVINRAC